MRIRLLIFLLPFMALMACTKPPVISNFLVSETSPCVVSVTCNVSGKVEESGLRYGKGSNLSTTILSDSPSGSLSFLLTDLQVDTDYSFCVYSVNSAGESVSETYKLTTSFFTISVSDNLFPSY